MKRSPDSAENPGSWCAPEFPCRIEWSVAVLEEIRAATVDAFLSLPHGGLEISGVLYGVHEAGRIAILAQRALECEHALGPTFTLSESDHVRLQALVAAGCPNLEPIGWYHSTRANISLSADDLEIYSRYFPEPWQVALIVRPQVMRRVRAGFFFREADGTVRADSSYQEFILARAADVAAESSPAGETAEAPSPAQPLPRLPLPNPIPRKPSWGRLWWAGVGVMLALSAGLLRSSRQPEPALPLSLAASDREGQLQIRWNRAAVRSAENGTLEIMDSGGETVVLLDKEQLRRGTLAYTRAGTRVDLRLVLRGRGWDKIEESASFIGSPPPAPDVVTPSLHQELEEQAARTLQLERDIADLRWLFLREKEQSSRDAHAGRTAR